MMDSRWVLHSSAVSEAVSSGICFISSQYLYSLLKLSKVTVSSSLLELTEPVGHAAAVDERTSQPQVSTIAAVASAAAIFLNFMLFPF